MGTLFRFINELIGILVFIIEADKDKRILETHITISFHFIFLMSTWRIPVSAENKAARLIIGLSHGVCASAFNSSIVRY